MHWLNLPKDTHTQLPNAVSVSQSVSLCPSWLPTQLNSASATASASALTIYLCISLAGRTHRRLQGLDVACEICAATWQRHLRVPSEYGAKDFDGIPLECHRWVQLQTCNLLERILHLASLPPLACALSATCRMHDLQLASCNLPCARVGGKLTTFCSSRESLINWAESLATHTMRTVVNTLKFLQVCVSVGYLHMLY